MIHLCVIINQRVPHLINDSSRSLSLQAEGSFDDRNFSGSGVEAGEGAPVVDDEAGANDFRSTVDGSGYEGDLEEGGEFVEFRTGGFGVYEAALELAVSESEHERSECEGEDGNENWLKLLSRSSSMGSWSSCA